jgi:hypothetical protein
MCAPQVSDRPDPNYDVPTLLGLADGTSGTEFCLLGGRTDLTGLRADVCDWSAVLDDAAPLIAQVEAQHCQAALPALIHYRLSRRALDPDVQCVAFITTAGRPSNRGDNGMGLCATSR